MHTQHERFRFRTLDELRQRIAELGLDLPLEEDLSPLARPVAVASVQAPNAIAIHPMEGCDGTADGRPGELTIRRYERFARGGAGLLWFEATAIMPAVRANPRQLTLTEETLPAFRALREHTLELARQTYGPAHRPLTVLQLTHSGRYSKPEGRPAPIIAFHDPLLDPGSSVQPEQAPISDEELAALPERYVQAARLAQEAGFDGVDIKSCHRYLLSELLAAHTRPGAYGGSFENRTRLLLEIVERVRAGAPGLLVAVRLNAYDGHPYPYGWGVAPHDPTVPDLTEPLRLVRALQAHGVQLLSITAGNPYYTPHINRPYDQPMAGNKIVEEHPLVGVARLVHLARAAQQAAPGLPVIGAGYSWLRQYLGNVAAGVLRRGWAAFAGLGREAFAYPNAPRDLLAGYLQPTGASGGLDPRQVCLACSRCSQIMRAGGMAGCPIRDKEVYRV